MWFSFGTLFCVPTPSGWAQLHRVSFLPSPWRSPWRGGCCAGPMAWEGSSSRWVFYSRKREDFAAVTEKTPRKHGFTATHPCFLRPVLPANLPQVGQRASESANWIVPNLHISQTLHHFLAAFSRLIQQMFSILLQDSNMRWAQNLAVIYLQLKFMTYTDIYIHLK